MELNSKNQLNFCPNTVSCLTKPDQLSNEIKTNRRTAVLLSFKLILSTFSRFYLQSFVIFQCRQRSSITISLESSYSENTAIKMYRLKETNGEKPISFSFEENGEQYMIGSEVSPVMLI